MNDRDRLFHLDIRDGHVQLDEQCWAKQGDALAWLVSGVFGLKQGRSIEAEHAIEAAQAFMRGDGSGNPEHLRECDDIHRELECVLAGHDPFWPRWVVWAEKQGPWPVIRFEPVPEPAEFHERARVPGAAWLANHPDAKRPRDYWSPFKGALAEGFRDPLRLLRRCTSRLEAWTTS